ncbi:hypothetical protein AVEN_87980-1, partial [Araneus ventricosus]
VARTNEEVDFRNYDVGGDGLGPNSRTTKTLSLSRPAFASKS